MFAEFTWGTQSIFAESHFYMIFCPFVDLNGLVFSNRFGPSEWVFCNVWLKVSLLFGMLISIYYLFGCYSPNTNAQQFINISKIIICRIACRVHIVERAWVGLGICGVCIRDDAVISVENIFSAFWIYNNFHISFYEYLQFQWMKNQQTICWINFHDRNNNVAVIVRDRFFPSNRLYAACVSFFILRCGSEREKKTLFIPRIVPCASVLND